MREHGRSRKRNRKKSWLISCGAAAAAAVVIVSAVAALRGRDTLKIDEPVYTCINGMPFEWEDGVRLLHDHDATTLKASGEKQELEAFPLITKESGSIIMQKSGTWNRTSDERFYRVDYFTVISQDEEGIVIRRDEKESRDISGFLYDNGDTYIFLEPAELTYNSQTVNIEPMTIVQVHYMGSIQIFGPGADTVFDYLAEEEVRAKFADGKRVNLATDTFFKKNGEWRLLFMPLDALKTIE